MKLDQTTKPLSEIIGEAIGEASMCWYETPTGVFDSRHAADLCKRTIELVEKHYELEPNHGDWWIRPRGNDSYSAHKLPWAGDMSEVALLVIDKRIHEARMKDLETTLAIAVEALKKIKSYNKNDGKAPAQNKGPHCMEYWSWQELISRNLAHEALEKIEKNVLDRIDEK